VKKKVIQLLTLSCILNISSLANVHKFSQFTKFSSTYFNRKSGKPALQFSFQKISKESPKIGFLKFSLPFYYVENLSVQIEMENMDSKIFWEDIKKYHEKEAIRFLQARNVKIHFLFKQQKKLLISSNSMKLKKDGTYLFSGEVNLKTDKQIIKHPSLHLYFSQGKGSYIIEKNGGQITLKIFEPSHFSKSEVINSP
jgi:hypothetical protein